MRRLLPIFLLAATPLFATDVLPPLFHAPAANVKAAAQPPLRASATKAAVVVATTGATKNDLAELRAANGKGGALHLGVIREIAPVRIAPVESHGASDGPWRWRGAVEVEGAARVRVRLDGVQLPPGTRMWIYGTSGDAVAFDASLAHDGVLWTPSIAGNAATIEVDAPRTASFRISAVADVRSASEVTPQGSECITDVSCQQVDTALGRGIAFYEYIGGTRLYGCTGGLVNNIKSDGTPFFLTANHCVKSQAQAATVEAYWDYRTSSCGGAAPARTSLQKTTGASLVVTSGASDVTLLRLSGIPAGRTFYGWDRRPVAGGVTLFHISHPNANPQRYSTSTLLDAPAACSDSPVPNFLYSRPVIGATDVGSSGAPVLYGAGYVVGQLKGACGPDPDNACNRENDDIDGAFAASYPVLAPYLDPPPACTACTPDATTACMLDHRFKVTVSWNDATYGAGPGKPIRFAENTPQTHPQFGPILETTFFAFYDFFPNSVETMVKMTKGVGINEKFWVFVTGFAGAEYTVKVQDTKTCATWERSIAANATAALRDYEAFPLP